MLKMASQMKNHTIVCGTGIMAQVIIDCLDKQNQPVVVVGENPTELAIIKRRHPKLPVIEGSPTSEIALADANLLSAQTVVATLEKEFDNLLISMTCKDLGNRIRVIARTDDPSMAGRLTKAGIDDVICPFQLTGHFAANMIIDPKASNPMLEAAL